MKTLLLIITTLIIPASHLFSQPNVQADSLYFIEDSVLIPTRSGQGISATIVRKKTQSGRLPAVLFYTTYHQGPRDNVFGKRSADRDFVGIVAYARGIRTDLKHYAPFEHDANDLYDIIDWLSKQAWCDGSVGMYGGSYTGFSQWAAAKTLHPALKTIVPQVAVMPGYDFPMENNVPLPHMLSWSNDIYKNKALRRDLVFDYFNQGCAFNKLDTLAGQPNAIFQKWLKHPAYDQYWQNMAPTAQDYKNINIPILSSTGYYDGSQIGAMNYLTQHVKNNPEANHYLVIGPYDHWGAQRKPATNLMGYAIDSVANISMMDLAFEWLAYILKGKAKPELLKDKITYQVMGTNTWKHAPSLNSMNNDTLTFFLHKNTLTPKKPTTAEVQKQLVDFKNRETQNSYYTPYIVFDSLDAGGGLVFSTATFDQEFCMNGSFIGTLFASITKKDMDVSLALYEVMPDNRYFFLTRYVGRASYAKDPAKRQLLKPGKKESIPFTNTRFVSKKISKGSRLLVVLNINKHPFEIINYGSGKPVSEETISDAGEALQIKWHNDSFIKIPIWKTQTH